MSLDVERFSKLANVTAKEMELNPNARNFKVLVDDYKSVLALV